MPRMRRPSYRAGVEWIAENDNPGGEEALIWESFAGDVVVGLLADLFGVAPERVAADVVKVRKKERLAEDVLGS